MINTTISATDRGQKVTIGSSSRAKGEHLKCYTTSPQKMNVDELLVTWTVTASGFGIDSCGFGLPLGIDCSGSGFSQSWTEEAIRAPGSSIAFNAPYGAYFDSGAFGDIRKVCSTVSARYAYRSGPLSKMSTTSCVEV